MRIFSTNVLVVATLVATYASPTLAQVAPPQPLGICVHGSCEAMRQGELYVATFGTSGGAPGLRTTDMEMEQQVITAFYGIDATRLAIAAGKMSEYEGAGYIESFEQTIRNFLHDLGNSLLVSAASGEAARLPEIGRKLGPILSVARQDALWGREELAAEAMQLLNAVLVTFSVQFVKTCQQQPFAAEVALGLERQNQMLGTGVSVFECARRLVVADIVSQRVNYHLESCSMSERDQWTLDLSGLVTGAGKGFGRRWHAEATYQGRKYKPTGDMEIFAQTVVVKEAPAVVPNDAGPNARPNGRPSEPIPPEQWRPTVKSIQKVRITTIKLVGEHGINGWTSNDQQWAEAEVAISDKPCKPEPAK